MTDETVIAETTPRPEGSGAMDNLKRLKDDELEQMSGGIIVEFGGTN